MVMCAYCANNIDGICRCKSCEMKDKVIDDEFEDINCPYYIDKALLFGTLDSSFMW